MCQCGCGDTAIERAFKVDRGPTIGYQVYRGCKDCHAGIGVDLYFYNSEGARDWCRGSVTEKAPKGDEYGGNNGAGIALPLFDVADLVEESKSLEPISEYDSLADWLEDFGLDLIQGALRRSHERHPH